MFTIVNMVLGSVGAVKSEYWDMFAALKIVIILVLAGLLLGAASLLSTRPRITGGEPAKKIPKLTRIKESVPDLSAEAVLMKRLKTGETLFERNAATKLPIASLTKLMTALILVETAGPLEKIEFSRPAKEIGEPDDKRSSAQAGERIRAEDVLKMLLISSDNDAAYAAAEHVAIIKNPALAQGLFQERAAFFTELMNQRAGELVLANTRFANPAGRDDPDNFSTAEDLAKLAEFIEKNRPELWAVSRMREALDRKSVV